MNTPHNPDQVIYPSHVAQKAALVGAGSAIPGLLIGATYGTLRTQTPILFSLVSGAQWFAIGSTFWTIRNTILHPTGLQNWWNLTRGKPLLPRHDLDPSYSDRVRASTISGAFTGTSLGFLFRGPRNVIPGTIMFSLFGWGGQQVYNFLDQRNSEAVKKVMELREQGKRPEKTSFVEWVAKSKWSPLSVMSDEEYGKLMGERLLAVEAEIALVDEKIEGLRKKQKEQSQEKK